MNINQNIMFLKPPPMIVKKSKTMVHSAGNRKA